MNAWVERLKWCIAKKEMQALESYRTACSVVYRWNGQVPNSAETAEWICEVGEGKRGLDIERFRERLLAEHRALVADIAQRWTP